MFKQLFDALKQLVVLGNDTQRNTNDIKAIEQQVRELRREMSNLTLIVQKLSFDIQRISENEKHEREKHALQLQAKLVEFERRLPPAKND